MIEEISCQLKDKSLLMTLYGAEDISVELFGGEAKKDLFEQVFGLKAIFLTPQE